VKIPKLFLNGTVWPIVVFVVILLLAFASRCRAEGSELWLEAGSSIARNEAPVLGFAINWPDAGPTDTDFNVGLHLIGASEGMRNQSALSFMLVDGFGRFDIGFGVCLLHHEDSRNGSRANFALSIAYRFGGKTSVRERHCSNAGQTDVNKGLDLFVVGRQL
jgi:hypothetical protein